jgi:hypothetical protein
VISPAALSRLPRVLIVDPERRLFERRLGEGTGAQLARWSAAPPPPAP